MLVLFVYHCGLLILQLCIYVYLFIKFLRHKLVSLTVAKMNPAPLFNYPLLFATEGHLFTAQQESCCSAANGAKSF